MKILNCRATVLKMLCTFWKFISFNYTCTLTIGIKFGSKSFFDACDSNHDLVFVDATDMQSHSIPQAILINEKLFLLHCLVERLQFNPENSHYIMDIKRNDHHWYRMDNSVRFIELSKFTQEERRIHVLSYARAIKKRQ